MLTLNFVEVIFPDLATVKDSLSLTNNQFVTFEIDKLTSVGNNLIISDNANLTSISASALTSIGGATEVSNNPKLGNDFLDAVELAAESSIAPALANPAASTTSGFSNSILPTPSFASYTQVIQSKISGSSKSNGGSIFSPTAISTGLSTSFTSSTTTDATNLPNHASSISSRSSLSDSAKALIGIVVIAGFLLIVGVIVMLYHCRSRRKTYVSRSSDIGYSDKYLVLTVPPPILQKDPIELSGDSKINELYGSERFSN